MQGWVIFLGFCTNCESLGIHIHNFIWGNCNAMQGIFENCKKLKNARLN